MAVAEPVKVAAAGSLKAALTQAGAAFTADQPGRPIVQFEFGASGLLRERIEAGLGVEVFASADIGHPKALAAQGKVESDVQIFTRNAMCALTRRGLTATPTTILSLMLEQSTRLGISTPKADPSGDYALAVFARADAVQPGAGAVLTAKALQLTGGKASPKAPDGRNQYAWVLDDGQGNGQADVFLTYCTNGLLAQRENPQIGSIALPPSMAVAAEYGLVELKGASPEASAFADFLRGPKGQAILASHAFASLN
jgi:ABC-type molybdate transport system substrate-binding protein